MQITEVTDFALRSAAITLRRDETPLEFVLFPMVHFAAPSFYAEVRRRLKACSVIVSEGMSGATLQSNAIDLANRYLPRGRQQGIVGQTDEIVLPKGIRVIRPDVPPAEPSLDLRDVPGLRQIARMMGLNLALVTSAHVIGAALALAGPRVLFTDDLAIHDFPFTLREEQMVRGDFPYREVILDARDRKLLEALARVHERRCQESIKVGVVYGAMHIPAVSDGLGERYGYRPRNAEWMTVHAPG